MQSRPSRPVGAPKQLGSPSNKFSTGFADARIPGPLILYSFFKNGKLRKTPDVQLNYDEFIVDLLYDFDGLEIKEERRKSSRPCHVYSRSFASARSFGKMSKAVAVFLDEARNLAPMSNREDR